LPFKAIADALGEVGDTLSDAINEASKRAAEARARTRTKIENAALDAGLEDTRWKNGNLYGRLFGARIKWYQTSQKPKNGPRTYTAHSKTTFAPPLAASFNVRTPGFIDHISSMFGGKKVKGKILPRNNELTRFMMTDDIRAGLVALRNAGAVNIKTGTLTLSTSGRMERQTPFLANGVRVAELVVARWQERLASIEALGFVPTSSPGVWDGHVDGVRIEVAETRRKKSLYTTVVRARLAVPLPEYTRIVRLRKKKKKPKGARPLGDMMLDRMLVAASSDIDAVAARVCTDAARAPLLEIVHGHLHSTLTATHIELRRNGPIVGDSGTRLVAELYNALHP